MTRKNHTTGAVIERGKVLSVSNGSYIVASLDRDGINTLPIEAVSGSFSAGDFVYFFVFNDGTGKIICGA